MKKSEIINMLTMIAAFLGIAINSYYQHNSFAIIKEQQNGILNLQESQLKEAVEKEKSQARGFYFSFTVDEVPGDEGYYYGVESPELGKYIDQGGDVNLIKRSPEDLKSVKVQISNRSDQPFRNVRIRFPQNNTILYNAGITNSVSSNKITADSDRGIYEIVKTSSSIANYNSPPVLKNFEYLSKNSVVLSNPIAAGEMVEEEIFILHVLGVHKDDPIFKGIKFEFEDSAGNKWVRSAGADVSRSQEN